MTLNSLGKSRSKTTSRLGKLTVATFDDFRSIGGIALTEPDQLENDTTKDNFFALSVARLFKLQTLRSVRDILATYIQ